MPVVSRRSRLPLAAGLAWLVLAVPAWAQVQRLSLSTAGVQADGGGDQPAIDHSGRVVAFRSFSTNLVGDDTNGASDGGRSRMANSHENPSPESPDITL